MKSKVRFISILVGVCCVLVGIFDLYLQYQDGREIIWRVPIILLGFGIGLPLFITPFTLFETDDIDTSTMSEEEYIEYSQKNLSGGVLGSITGENADYDGDGGHYSDD